MRGGTLQEGPSTEPTQRSRSLEVHGRADSPESVQRLLLSAHAATEDVPGTFSYMSAVNARLRSPIDKSYHDKKKRDFKGHPAQFKKATIALARHRHRIIYRILVNDEVYDPSRLAASTVERARKATV